MTNEISKPILVVEDEADLRENLKALLELEGYHVDTAAHGREALDYLERSDKKPGLILLDLMMPVMNGLEFLVELKKRLPSLPIPVIVISAVADGIERVAATGYIKKPINLDLLLSLASQYCGPTNSHGGPNSTTMLQAS